MNKFICTATLTSDPEASTTKNGKDQTKFRIAVRRNFRNSSGKYDADFFSVIAWGGTANFVNSYLVKGSKVFIDGEIRSRTYEAQDGSKRYGMDIIATVVEAMGPKAKKDTADQGAEEFIEVPEEELPELPFM